MMDVVLRRLGFAATFVVQVSHSVLLELFILCCYLFVINVIHARTKKNLQKRLKSIRYYDYYSYYWALPWGTVWDPSWFGCSVIAD